MVESGQTAFSIEPYVRNNLKPYFETNGAHHDSNVRTRCAWISTETFFFDFLMRRRVIRDRRVGILALLADLGGQLARISSSSKWLSVGVFLGGLRWYRRA
jgi:hypothetical protein